MRDVYKVVHKDYANMATDEIVSYYRELDDYLKVVKIQYNRAKKYNLNTRGGHFNILYTEGGRYHEYLMILDFRYLELCTIQKEMKLMITELQKREIGNLNLLVHGRKNKIKTYDLNNYH